MPRQYSVKTVIAALKKHQGLLSLAADALKCSRSTLYRYAKAYPEVAAVVEEERERLVDLAEDALYHHLQERSPWAISLVLRTLGRARGYGEEPKRPDPKDREDLAAWPKIQSAILQALAAHPDAKLAVVDALKAWESHESSNGAGTRA